MKKGLWIAVVLILMLQLAACGSSKGTENTQGGQNSPDVQNGASPTPSPKDVKLRYSWWGSDDRNKAILAAIEEYQKQNPHVKIEGEFSDFSSYYQKLLTQLAGSTAPDIISVDNKWVADLVAKGKPFVDMNTLKDQIDMSGLDMNYVATQAEHDGYLLGLPLSVNAMGLLYNKDALAAANINIDNNWDCDALMEAGTKLHQADKSKHLMFLTNDHYIYFLKMYMKQKTGNNLINDDYTLGFSREELVDAFTYFKQMLDNGVIPPFEEAVQYESVYADQIPNWLNGSYTIFPTSASKIPSIEAVSKFGVDVARYPVFKNPKNPGIITPLGIIISINAKSPHVEESAKFIDWMLNSEEAALIIKDANGMPASQKTVKLLEDQNLVNPNIAKMVEISMPFAGTPENSLSLNPEIDAILKDFVHLLGFRKSTPEQTADNLIKEVTNKLNELKKNN